MKMREEPPDMREREVLTPLTAFLFSSDNILSVLFPYSAL
jgi:hypothetical protein